MPDQNILVIDDSCLVNDVVRDVLLAAGYGVHQALNGEDALSVLAANSFDLLLIDVEMPKMDGYTLLSRIRTMPRWATTPVLMLRTR
ncbi:MAG TPA: response regulator, partial [Chloroflexota bacterium]|nr:response regulator [Chloroflexota bacterium]